MKSILILIAVTLFGSIQLIAAQETIAANNKRVVEAFYNLAFNKHKPKEAMDMYVGETYTQHNPHVGDGKQPFIDYFSAYFPKNPEASAEIKRSIAEGDLVVLHVLSKVNKGDRGRAVVDIFRVINGKIIEHWDVAQPIPDKSANSNSMF